MRVLPVLFLFAAGCLPLDAEPEGLWTGSSEVSDGGMIMSGATLGFQFESAGVSADGSTVHADMGGGTWCGFRSSDGYMETDTQLSMDVTVQDVRENIVLVSHDGGMSLVIGADLEYDYWAPEGNLVSARFRDEGVAALTADGLLHWFNGGDESSVRVGDCSVLQVDQGSDTAWLACSDGLVRARAGSFAPMASGTEVLDVAWSDAAQTALALDADHTTLRTYDADGTALTTVTLASPVLSLAAVGSQPYFVAVLDDGRGTTIALLDDEANLVDQLAAGQGTMVEGAADSGVFAVYGDMTSAVYRVVE